MSNQAVPAGCALWFVDGHADFYDGESSPTGEAADMDLSILTGHGPSGLLEREGPLVDPGSVILLGHRPADLDADIVAEFVEPGRSATTVDGRPVFQQMMARIKAEGGIDYIIVYARSRMHRNSVDAAITTG